MSITHAKAQRYLGWYDRHMEGLARVRFKLCAQRSLFCLAMWEDREPGMAQVYRIPGLLFDGTIPEGVGLIVCRGVVLDKMLYGTPACPCRRCERVHLGSAVL